jgi:hypothetical protein
MYAPRLAIMTAAVRYPVCVLTVRTGVRKQQKDVALSGGPISVGVVHQPAGVAQQRGELAGRHRLAAHGDQLQLAGAGRARLLRVLAAAWLLLLDGVALHVGVALHDLHVADLRAWRMSDDEHR